MKSDIAEPRKLSRNYEFLFCVGFLYFVLVRFIFGFVLIIFFLYLLWMVFVLFFFVFFFLLNLSFVIFCTFFCFVINVFKEVKFPYHCYLKYIRFSHIGLFFAFLYKFLSNHDNYKNRIHFLLDKSTCNIFIQRCSVSKFTVRLGKGGGGCCCYFFSFLKSIHFFFSHI